MKALSAISHIIAVIFIALGSYNMFFHPQEFGGDVYTFSVSLAYAQAYFTLAFIMFFLGFVFGYFSNKNPKGNNKRSN